jgi:predicted nucleic acid-binding protein
VSGLLDTNVAIRYLTGDPPTMAEQATAIIEGAVVLYLTDAMIAETAYVLTRTYGLPRETVVDSLLALVRRRNLTPLNLDKGIVIQALLLCRPPGRVSFADVMIWAAARSSAIGTVYTFDRRFPSDGISVRHESR